MRAILALTVLAPIAVVFSLEQHGREQHARQRLLQGRELRKDYGSSDYQYEYSSAKSGKSSGKASKSSIKSGKGSKSGKSSKSSHASYDDEGYGQDSSGKGGESSDVHSATSGYHAKVGKWHQQPDDDDIYDLGGTSGGGYADGATGSTVTIDDDMMIDNFDDAKDDASNYDDWGESSSNGEGGGDTESSPADASGAEASNGSSDSGSTENVVDDSLNQNSWLVDIIDGDGDDSNTGDNVTDDTSSEIGDDAVQNKVTTPANTGNEVGVVSGSETSNDIALDSNPTDESESFWVVLNPETDWMMSISQNDSSMSMDFQEDQVPDFDFDSSMSIYPLEDDFPELGQFEVEFGSMSMPKSSDDESNTVDSDHGGGVTNGAIGDDDGGKVNNGGGDSSNTSSNGTDGDEGNDGATDDNVADDDNGDSDDTIEVNNGKNDKLSYLTVQERAHIIQEKCNATPLGRALSLIRIIGSHVDPQEILSQSANSPHYLAFLWLVYLDDAILCPPSSQEDVAASAAFDGAEEDITRLLAKINDTKSIRARSPTVSTSIMERHETLDRILQRYALAMLYYSFNGYEWDNCPSDRNFFNATTLGDCVDVNGEELVRFLDTAHECTWFGITCSLNSTENINVDEHNPVTRLELPATSLHGNIPQDITLLHSLEVVNLRDNELTGTIPFGAFATMGNLDTLILSGNKKLSGNANQYCDSGSSLNEMFVLETDCTPLVEELKPAPVQCSCCTSCL